jgi:TatD DNase family protein
VTRPDAPAPLEEPVIDAHCHMELAYGDEPALSVTETLKRAQAAGVVGIVQTGFDLASSQLAVDLADEHRAVIAAVALHPNEVPALSVLGQAALDEQIAAIDELAASDHVVAIGETGMDFFRTGPEGRDAQEYSFRAHIRIAKRHDKALVIHDRDAHDDVIRILLDEGAPERVMFHSYSGDADMARVCAQHGWFMSFSGTVTYKNAPALREALAIAPLESILVETDAPFLPPVPHRGQPNASYLTPLTVRLMAQVRGQDEHVLSGALRANAPRLFGGAWWP